MIRTNSFAGLAKFPISKTCRVLFFPPSSRASPRTKLDRSPSSNATDSNLKFISIKPRSYFAGVELQTWEQSFESNRIPPLHTGRGIIDQFQAASSSSSSPPSPRLSKYICNKERERGSVWWPNLRLLVNDTRWQQFTEREYFARTN